MIKNILWDFDGVILDSMKVKGDGFKELFQEYDIKQVNLLEKYHFENGGVSRFEKIKYFYTQVLCQNITQEDILVLSEKFAKIIEKKLFNKDSLIEETVEYIVKNYQNYNFHIVSGAEHNELNNLCNFFDLSQYFISISGSPTKKELLVSDIMNQYNYIKKETILIGDAITDYEAAFHNGISFYGYNNENLKKFNYINSFEKVVFDR